MVVSLNEAGVTNDQQQVQSQNKKFSSNILVLQDQATNKTTLKSHQGRQCQISLPNRKLVLTNKMYRTRAIGCPFYPILVYGYKA